MALKGFVGMHVYLRVATVGLFVSQSLLL